MKKNLNSAQLSVLTQKSSAKPTNAIVACTTPHVNEKNQQLLPACARAKVPTKKFNACAKAASPMQCEQKKKRMS
jgi:hypothetical protein